MGPCHLRLKNRIDLILAEKAVRFHQQGQRPAAIPLSGLRVSPHVPIAPAQEFKGSSRASHYEAFVQQLDAAVRHHFAEALETRGLADGTRVIFTGTIMALRITH
ncbi:MAG: hypothetical protein IPG06_02440 [Haliea sp.]|nr:hypothetical protein [Haliea sp.]